MSSFIPYKTWRESNDTKSPLVEDKVHQFEIQDFKQESKKHVNKTAETNHVGFKLDPRVAQRLFLDQKYQQQIEKEVQTEIEKRWITAKEKAEVSGFAAGLEQGKKDAYISELPKIASVLDDIGHLIDSLKNQKIELVKENESLLINLVCIVAKRLFLKEVSLDEEYIKRLIYTLVEKVSESESITICVSEKDKAAIINLEEQIKAKHSTFRDVTVEANNSIKEGGCIVETKSGIIDARIETQIRKLIESMYSSKEK